MLVSYLCLEAVREAENKSSCRGKFITFNSEKEHFAHADEFMCAHLFSE